MDRDLRKLLQYLLENERSSFLLIGSDAKRRTDWARAILEERSGLDRVVVLESDRDWERAGDDVDAVIVPSVTAVSDDRQLTLLEWMTEGTRVVAAGAADPDAAVEEEELRVDLYYRLNVAPFPLDAFEATRTGSPDEVLDAAREDATGAEGGSERAVPPEWLADWCARANVEPTRAWRHAHLEDGELWTMELGSPSAPRAWRRLSETADDLGYQPVVTTGREAVDTLLERQHFEHEAISPETADWRLEDWRRAAAGVDVDGWIAQVIEREKAEGLGASYFDPEPFEAPERDDENSFLVERADDGAAITLVPVDAAAEVPAFFHYGGYNANPQPDRHVAMLRRWADAWDATVFGISPDILELYVPEPVRDADDAVAIARQQHVYCPSVPVENIAGRARSVQNAHWWTFWWD